jgi:hypothetical protein
VCKTKELHDFARASSQSSPVNAHHDAAMWTLKKHKLTRGQKSFTNFLPAATDLGRPPGIMMTTGG